MSDEPDAYQTYLLRLWRARCRGVWQWRASLESRHTGERQVFGSLEQLFTFLCERCEGQVAGAPQAGKEAWSETSSGPLGTTSGR
jgi:hypothetical protein